MTLGRVYVPPDRSLRKPLSDSLNNNVSMIHTNSLIVNGHSCTAKSDVGYRTIEIKVSKEPVIKTKEKSNEVQKRSTKAKVKKKKSPSPAPKDPPAKVEAKPSPENGFQAEDNQSNENSSSLSSIEIEEAIDVNDHGDDVDGLVVSVPIEVNVERVSNGNQIVEDDNAEEADQLEIPSRWKEFQDTDDSTEITEQVAPLTNGTSAKIIPALPNHAKGLKNLGNTCFMNSIIQCLAHTIKLLEFCQESESNNLASTFIGNVASTAREPKITRAFVKLLQDMWKDSTNGPGYSSNHGVTDPSNFRREMTVFAPKFSGYDQHDSQEFLQYVLEGLHAELNRVEQPKKKNSGNCVNGNSQEIETKEAEGKSKRVEEDEETVSAEEAGSRAWKLYLQRENSFITDLFLGQFRSTLRFSDCGHESVTFEPFWVVSLPINAKTSKDIIDCLQLFVAEETLDGDERPTCEKCKTRQKCKKWYSFEKWPKILVLHLKRFAPTGSYRAKLSSVIASPLKNLDLSSFSSSKLNQTDINHNGYHSDIIYDCYGISNHSGTLSGGHYTAFCRHPVKTHDWHLYNDRCVSGENPDRVVTAEAYLLFFERQE